MFAHYLAFLLSAIVHLSKVLTYLPLLTKYQFDMIVLANFGIFKNISRLSLVVAFLSITLVPVDIYKYI